MRFYQKRPPPRFASLSAMTAETWMERFYALVNKHVKQMAAGEITESEANHELEVMTLDAQMDMSDEEFEEFLRQVMIMDYAVSVQLSADGHPVPGNDPRKPN
jgi:hypothetical protein